MIPSLIFLVVASSPHPAERDFWSTLSVRKQTKNKMKKKKTRKDPTVKTTKQERAHRLSPFPHRGAYRGPSDELVAGKEGVREKPYGRSDRRRPLFPGLCVRAAARQSRFYVIPGSLAHFSFFVFPIPIYFLRRLLSSSFFFPPSHPSV